MTKREMFAALREMAVAANREDLVAGIDHEVELLNRKNSAERKPTVNQLDNVKIKKAIAEGMVPGTMYTVTEVIKNVLGATDWKDITCSRATAVMTQMLEEANPRIKREVIKRKAMYSLV